LNRAGQVQWGVPFAHCPLPAGVIVLTHIPTIGGQARHHRHVVEEHGLRVNRSVALIDCRARPVGHVDDIPFASVLRLPLALYCRARNVLNQPGGAVLGRVGLLAS
jgi:hypothetical protein